MHLHKEKNERGGDTEQLPSPEAMELGCARARLAASPSELTFHPSLSHPPTSPRLRGPASRARGRPPAAARLRGGRPGPDCRPARGGAGAGARRGGGHGGSGGERGHSPQPRPSRAPAAGSQSGPAPPPSSTWDAPEPRVTAKAQTSPPLSPAPARGRAGRCEERGPRLFTRDLGTRGGGWKEHSPSPPAAAAAAAAPRPRLLPARAPPRALAAAR